MFELFEIVVYRGYGVARISREVIKKIENRDVCFFELNFINKEVKILVPKIDSGSTNLRKLHSKEEIEDIFIKFMNNFSEYNNNWLFNISLISWNRRSKDYQMKVLSGDIDVILKIYVDLNFIEKNKKLSFGERTILSQVEDLIVEEMAVIFNQSKEEVIFSLRSFVNSFFDIFENNKAGEILPGAGLHFPYFSMESKKNFVKF